MKEKILDFLKETLSETKKVVWPDRRYVAVATVIVLVLVVLTVIFVTIVDFGFAEAFKVILK